MIPLKHPIDDLKKLSLQEIQTLFARLSAPSIQEMHGEYQARLLRQVSPTAQKLGQAVLYNGLIGHWLCKAFRPVDAHSGRGYNSFAHKAQVVQRYPMHTMIAPSRYDGKPAYTLIYRAFHSTCGRIHMVDEVRRLDENRLLGIGTCGLTDRQRMVPMPFVLVGPVDAYRRDIGRERRGFSVQHAVPGLLGAQG